MLQGHARLVSEISLSVVDNLIPSKRIDTLYVTEDTYNYNGFL